MSENSEQSEPEATPQLSWCERMERSLAALSVKNNFWHRFFSYFFLPPAWKSGITMKWREGLMCPQVPYKRVNRNWYGAMAGAALAGNAEIAGSLILNYDHGRNFTCVCKSLSYKFLRPCLGMAEYRMQSMTGLEEGLASGKEFNVTINMRIFQVDKKIEKFIGKAEVVYHLVPKSLVGCNIFNPFGTRKKTQRLKAKS